MTDASVSVGYSGGEAPWPTGAEKLPAFLAHAGQTTERDIQLQDFRLGHVLAQTVSILRRHLLPFLLLYLVASLLLNVPVTFTKEDSPVADVALACGIAQILYMVFGAFAGAAVAYAAIDDMRGQPVDIGAAMRVALRWFFPVLGATAIVVVVFILGLALMLVPAAIAISAFFVVVPACVVEGLGPLQAMRRSAELTKGHRWRIFALALAVIVAEVFVQMELDQVTRPFGNDVLILGPQVLWDAVVGAFVAVATAVAYRDLRVAKEGVDTVQVATVFD